MSGLHSPHLETRPMRAAARRGVSAVIVSYHSGPCLWTSIGAACSDPLITEVVVVNNGNPPDVLQSLRLQEQSVAKLKVISGHGNIGFSAGCNLGVSQATGDFLVFLNPDLSIRPGAIRRLLAAHAHSAAAGPVVIGGRLLGLDGREQRGARRDAITPWSALVTFSGLGRLQRLHPAFRDPHRERDPLPVGPQRVGAVSGAMLLMTRADFLALGGFDEGYFLHVEDLDLCRRAHQASGEVIFAPDAEGVHIGATSKASHLFVERCKAQGFARYFSRHANGPSERVLVAAVVPALGAAFVLRGLLKDAPSRLRSQLEVVRSRRRARRATA